jgi:WD40 repeat protein
MEYDPILVARGHEGPITSVVCSSSQGKIYSSSYDCTIRVWEAPNFPIGTQMDNPGNTKYLLT